LCLGVFAQKERNATWVEGKKRHNKKGGFIQPTVAWEKKRGITSTYLRGGGRRRGGPFRGRSGVREKNSPCSKKKFEHVERGGKKTKIQTKKQ